jgi:putative transposase
MPPTTTAPVRRDAAVYERRRLEAVRGFEAKESRAGIARRLGVSPQAVHVWWQRYRRQGAAGLARRPRPGRPPKLPRTALQRLPALLAKGADAYGFPTAVWTTQTVADLLWRRFRVRYDRDHVSRLLRAQGLSYQKTEGRAVERDEVAIQRWVTRTWPRIKKKPARKAGS